MHEGVNKKRKRPNRIPAGHWLKRKKPPLHRKSVFACGKMTFSPCQCFLLPASPGKKAGIISEMRSLKYPSCS